MAFASVVHQGSPVGYVVVDVFLGSLRSTYHTSTGRSAAWKLFTFLADLGLHTLYCPELFVLQVAATVPCAFRHRACVTHKIAVTITMFEHRGRDVALFSKTACTSNSNNILWRH